MGRKVGKNGEDDRNRSVVAQRRTEKVGRTEKLRSTEEGEKVEKSKRAERMRKTEELKRTEQVGKIEKANSAKSRERVEKANNTKNRERVEKTNNAKNRERVEKTNNTKNRERVEKANNAKNRERVEKINNAKNRERVEKTKSVKNRERAEEIKKAEKTERLAQQRERVSEGKHKRGSGKQSLCHAFGDCGGCQLLGVPYEEQLVKKKQDLSRLLKPYVKLEGMIGMDEPEHYRNKVNAAFTHDKNGRPLSGVYKEGTHYIIPIEECILENQKADEIIGSIRGLLPSFKIKTYDEDTGYGLLRHVMVRVGHTTGQIMVVLVLASPVMPSKNNFVKALLKLHPDITTIVVSVNNHKTSMVLGDKEQVIYGKGYIEDVLCGITFKISPKSFYQVNSVQTEKLYGKAIEYAGLTGRETVLDAYCGIGTIGMIAASKAKKVIGVELNRDAVRDAVVNARKNNIKNMEFYQKDAGEFMVQLAEQGVQIDTVFMDPPRTGSDEVFLDSLAMLKPKKVVYVSCNPETLVRDLEILVKKGYRVRRGVGCDMFPFCRHVETVVLIQRKDT